MSLLSDSEKIDKLGIQSAISSGGAASCGVIIDFEVGVRPGH